FRRYVVEFVGTYFLVLTMCMTIGNGSSNLAPLAAGMMLMALIYSGHHISGGHFNPGVSVASWLRGQLPASDVLPYVIAQFLGGTAAAIEAGFLSTSAGLETIVLQEPDIAASLNAEFLGALLFVYVFLNLTIVRKTTGNLVYGLALGTTYTACIYAFGPVSIGAFNPAVALGFTVANIASWASIWVFMVANFAGSILAVFLSQYLNGPYERKD